MRNMKKFLALVLAMMMMLSMAVVTTSAADEADYTDAAMHLNALNVMKGDLSGDLMLDADVTRYQTALFFVQALTGKTDAAIWNAEKTSANFTDVNEYGTAIDYAYGVGVVRGRGNGVFGFNDKILYQDMIVMAVRALGYETADMQYPYGHILAAQKLGLTDNIDNVNYKAELKRGETAQLIWNMLQTEIAAIDPLTDKILYPGEKGLTDAIVNAGKDPSDEDYYANDRITLLEDSGLAGDKITVVIEEFVEADEDDEDSVDTLVLDNGLTVAAADFGITAETPKVNYLGLEFEVFVTVDEEDLDQDAYDEGDAEIVLVSAPEYTIVENLGDAANIKYVPNEDDDKSYVSLGGTKFVNKNYEGELFLFGEDGWERQPQEAWEALAASYLYDTKDGYIGEGNTYGKVAYRLIEQEDDKTIVEVLYTEYTFGQYVERELVSAATGAEEKFVILGTLGNSLTTDVEGNDTYVTEKLVDGGAVSAKISKTKGEAALSVTVEGVEVKSGDFMFYNYNDVDNILTVAQNCGTFATGRLTAHSPSKETVKISGTNYGFGFDGLYDAFVAYEDVDVDGDYVDLLEAGQDNAQFLAVNGSIVWMMPYAGETTSTTCDFAIVSTNVEVMTDLLGISETKYTEKLVDGYYIEDGYVVVAVLDTATGKWALANVEGVATDYDTEEAEFVDVVDIATLAKYADIANLSDAKLAQYNAGKAVLPAEVEGLYAIAEVDGDVYTLADINTRDAERAFLVDRSDVNEAGLVFNTNGRTNLIKATADEEVDEARVTTGDDSVIVVLGANGIGVRTGKQTAKKSVETDAIFFAADANLIVLAAPEFDVQVWGQGASAAADENFYVAMPGYGVEYDVETEEEYTLTISGLFDLKTLETADDIVITGETVAELKAVVEGMSIGTVFFMDEDGVLAQSETSVPAAMAYLLGEDYFVVDVEEWVDEESITVPAFELDAATAISEINAKVVTFDFVDAINEFDWADLDLDSLFISVEYDEALDEAGVYDAFGEFVTIDVEGAEYIAAEIDLDDVVTEITAPTVGLYSAFEQAMYDSENVYLAPVEDTEEYAAFAAEYAFVAEYDEDTEVLNLYILRAVFALGE